MLPIYAYLSTSVFKSYLKVPKSFAATLDLSAALLVILVLLLLGLTLSFLVRNTWFQGILNNTSVVYANPFRQSQNLPVIKIHNPFLFQLKDPQLCTLDKVKCVITSQCPCLVRAFWCVNLKDLDKLLYTRDWLSFKSDLSEEMFHLGGFKDLKDDLVMYPELKEMPFEFGPINQLDNSLLGVKPRSKYPLVVCIVRDEIITESNAVTAMIVAIHIKDDLCDIDTAILSHYLKQANGQCSKLQPLFIANAEQSGISDYTSHDSNDPPSCVVCLTNPITHALLPCRHMCICQSCFKLIDKCPLCRGYIQSYFSDETTEESALRHLHRNS